MISAYSSSYPDIHFITLGGSSDIAEVDAVMKSLGKEAVNVDYEHPPAMRQTLLDVQAERIRRMLVYGLPSATLFRTGSETSIPASHVCVITLDADAFDADRHAATRFVLEDVDFDARAYIDNEDYLYFALDHEIFHCLDAYLNGPTHPRTWDEISARYYDYRAERRADLYAALTQRTRKPGADRILIALAASRTMSLANWDLPHYTAPILEAALDLDRSLFAELSLHERARFAMQHSGRTLVSPERYRDFVAAAAELSLTRGRGEAAFSPMYRELLSEGIQADEALVQQLVERVENAKRQLDSLLLPAN